MTVRELPPGWEADSVLLLHSAFGASWDPRDLSVQQFEKAYPRPADYLGLCAVERGRIVSSVAVYRFPFRTRTGDCTCSGLGAVATLPTYSRRGLARRLIEEAHRRERQSGSRFALLYTGRSIVAHSLYESLDYHDVLDFPSAVRLVPRAKLALPPGWLWRRAQRDDRRTIEGLRARWGRSRCGFTREGSEWCSGPPPWFAPGPQGWLVLKHGGSVVGYAGLSTEGRVRACREGMAEPGLARSLLLRCLESEASGKWLLLDSPLVHELRTAPGTHAYTAVEGSHSVLMAKALDAHLGGSDLVRELGTDRPDFLFGMADTY